MHTNILNLASVVEQRSGLEGSNGEIRLLDHRGLINFGEICFTPGFSLCSVVVVRKHFYYLGRYWQLYQVYISLFS